MTLTLLSILRILGKPRLDFFLLELCADVFLSRSYQKTKNMDALLAEGRKRRSKRSEARAPVNAAEIARKKSTPTTAADGESLNKLIESVKRKAGETGGRGKRTKTG